MRLDGFPQLNCDISTVDLRVNLRKYGRMAITVAFAAAQVFDGGDLVSGLCLSLHLDPGAIIVK